MMVIHHFLNVSEYQYSLCSPLTVSQYALLEVVNKRWSQSLQYISSRITLTLTLRWERGEVCLSLLEWADKCTIAGSLYSECMRNEWGILDTAKTNLHKAGEGMQDYGNTTGLSQAAQNHNRLYFKLSESLN